MIMKPSEILKDYNQAADKKKQLLILAQLNACSTEEIKQVLREQGVDYRSFPRTNSKDKSNDAKSKKKRSSETSKKSVADVEVVIQYIKDLKEKRNALVAEINQIDRKLSEVKDLCTTTGFSNISTISTNRS